MEINITNEAQAAELARALGTFPEHPMYVPRECTREDMQNYLKNLSHKLV